MEWMDSWTVALHCGSSGRLSQSEGEMARRSKQSKHDMSESPLLVWELLCARDCMNNTPIYRLLNLPPPLLKQFSQREIGQRRFRKVVRSFSPSETVAFPVPFSSPRTSCSSSRGGPVFPVTFETSSGHESSARRRRRRWCKSGTSRR